MYRALAISLLLPLLAGCYSFRGVSLDPAIETYYVAPFANNAENALPSLSKTMEDALREKVRTESRLRYDDTDPDVEFRGALVEFRISS